MSARRWVLSIVVATIVALATTGAAYQTASVSRESSLFPPPGQFINVAGPGERAERRLHLICLGSGEPTVIFEPSAFGNATSSKAAREEVSAQTRVCSYDRMGAGWSDPGPSVISVGMLADDLEHLTKRAGLRPPFILVPASFGGLTAELFARRHPDQVAGLVFVDAANSILLDRFTAQLTWKRVEAACLVKTAARFGILRLLDPLGLRREPANAGAAAIARLYRVELMTTLCGVLRGAPITTQELSAAPPLAPDVPLVVLVHERPDHLAPPGFAAEAQKVESAWLSLQQEFAQRSRRGTWRVVPGSDHLIGTSQPHAVANAVLDMISSVRSAR